MENIENTEIGERLIDIRKALDIKQGLFAAKLGFASGNGLSMIEKGRNPLRETHCKILEFTYNVNIEWLKTGNGEMFLNNTVNTIKQLNINNPQTKQTMNDETLNRLLAIIEKQQDDIHIAILNVKQAQENQSVLINKIPGEKV